MKKIYAFVFAVTITIFSSASAKDLIVTAVGDYGANETTKSVLNKIDEMHPDIHFALGDFSYSQLPEKEWCAFVRMNAPTTPFTLLSGNHESDGKDGHIEKFAECLPYNHTAKLHGEYTREYYLDVPTAKPLARFIMISPDLQFADAKFEYKNNNKHSKWLHEAVAGARKQGIKWVIVGMHKVCITTDQKGCEVGTDLIDQIIKENVDLVIAGHSHVYERTHQLSCMKPKKFEASCVAAKGDVAQKGKGTVFITNGTGGIGNRDSNRADPEFDYFARVYAKNAWNAYGPTKLTINANSLTAELVDAKSGKIIDEVVVK